MMNVLMRTITYERSVVSMKVRGHWHLACVPSLKSVRYRRSYMFATKNSKGHKPKFMTARKAQLLVASVMILAGAWIAAPGFNSRADAFAPNTIVSTTIEGPDRSPVIVNPNSDPTFDVIVPDELPGTGWRLVAFVYLSLGLILFGSASVLTLDSSNKKRQSR